MNGGHVFLAIHHGEEAVRIKPNDPMAWLNLAQYYQAAGQKGQAERCNRKAREVERKTF